MRPTLLVSIVLFSAVAVSAPAAQLVDDREISIHSGRDVVKKREALIQYLWGGAGFPTRRDPVVKKGIDSPVKALSNVARVDELKIPLTEGLEGLAYHFVPSKPNRELVVVHHGHACTLDDDPSPNDVGYGLQRTINALLREGYGVLGVFMPHMRPGDCTGGHDALCRTNTTGSPIKFFLEPTAISLNYLEKPNPADEVPTYNAFHMTGLSGGGWTTTVYAALDTRIRCSVPVAGTIPLYLRTGGSVGDLEQYEPAFYKIAGYPELYILGAHGKGRSQIQVLVRKDDCCFGEKQHDAKTAELSYSEAMLDYEGRVRLTLFELGKATFRLEIDETAPSHMISHHTIEKILIPELKNAAAEKKR